MPFGTKYSPTAQVSVFTAPIFPNGANVCFHGFLWSSPSTCLPICLLVVVVFFCARDFFFALYFLFVFCVLYLRWTLWMDFPNRKTVKTELEGKWKVRTTKNHENRHLCRMELPCWETIVSRHCYHTKLSQPQRA